MVSPIAVTTCQKAAVSGRISCAAAAVDSTIRVVSDGDAISSPVSAATALVAPLSRSSKAVTIALTTITPSTASNRLCQLAAMILRSRLMPTVIRKTPSASPRNGAVITSTSV